MMIYRLQCWAEWPRAYVAGRRKGLPRLMAARLARYLVVNMIAMRPRV
jgi:hypothetical protein